MSRVIHQMQAFSFVIRITLKVIQKNCSSVERKYSSLIISHTLNECERNILSYLHRNRLSLFPFFVLLFCFFAFSAWGDEDTSSLRRKQTLARNRNQSVLLGIFGGFFPKKVCIFLTRSSVKFIIKIKPTFLRIDSTTIQICEAFLLFV